MGMSKTSLARVISACTWGLPDQVRSILNKYESTLLIPGVDGVLRFGYQPGNYRESTGQTLAAADQQVGLVVDAARGLGPELVANGTFDSDVSGWVPDTAGATVTWSSGRMVVGSDANGFKAGRQVIATEIGKMYRITGVKSGGTATAGKLRVFSGSAEIVRYNYASASSVNLGGVFVATTTATTIQCFIDTANATSEWDNISVRELPGIHASQSTSGFQPVLRNEGGIQSWQFDGMDDRLSLSAVPFQMADDHFVIGGATVSDFSGLRALFGAYSSSQISPRMQMYCAQTTGACIVQLRGDSGASAVPSAGNATANQPFVFGWEKQGGVVRALFDNAVSINASTASVGALTVDVAAIGETKGAFHNGMIHGLIVGKGAISASERQTLVRFMASLQGRTL